MTPLEKARAQIIMGITNEKELKLFNRAIKEAIAKGREQAIDVLDKQIIELKKCSQIAEWKETIELLEDIIQKIKEVK